MKKIRFDKIERRILLDGSIDISSSDDQRNAERENERAQEEQQESEAQFDTPQL